MSRQEVPLTAKKFGTNRNDRLFFFGFAQIGRTGKRNSRLDRGSISSLPYRPSGHVQGHRRKPNRIARGSGSSCGGRPDRETRLRRNLPPPRPAAPCCRRTGNSLPPNVQPGVTVPRSSPSRERAVFCSHRRQRHRPEQVACPNSPPCPYINRAGRPPAGTSSGRAFRRRCAAASIGCVARETNISQTPALDVDALAQSAIRDAFRVARMSASVPPSP